MCDESITPPLKIIFDTALKSGIYPDKWKRANVVPVHKKESKNILKIYRAISLLPICRKIFEKCIYNSLYSYLESNNILSKSFFFLFSFLFVLDVPHLTKEHRTQDCIAS